MHNLMFFIFRIIGSVLKTDLCLCQLHTGNIFLFDNKVMTCDTFYDHKIKQESSEQDCYRILPEY